MTGLLLEEGSLVEKQGLDADLDGISVGGTGLASESGDLMNVPNLRYAKGMIAVSVPNDVLGRAIAIEFTNPVMTIVGLTMFHHRTF